MAQMIEIKRNEKHIRYNVLKEKGFTRKTLC
jgi:hypothetical protein